MIQDKTLSAENGHNFIWALLKDTNAVLNHLVSSLRASREGAVPGVAPLGKGSPFPARRALRPTPSRLAEPVNIILKEYQVQREDSVMVVR